MSAGQGKLFLSFWHICLDNLPEGAFTRRSITPEEAKDYIEQARQQKQLLCVSDDDLLAPYKKHEQDNHDALCDVLNEHFGIALSLRDFLNNGGTDDDPCYSINPLVCVQIEGHDRLIVITCGYTLGENIRSEALAFTIDPATVEFHVIESVEALVHA